MTIDSETFAAELGVTESEVEICMAIFHTPARVMEWAVRYREAATRDEQKAIARELLAET